MDEEELMNSLSHPTPSTIPAPPARSNPIASSSTPKKTVPTISNSQLSPISAAMAAQLQAGENVVADGFIAEEEEEEYYDDEEYDENDYPAGGRAAATEEQSNALPEIQLNLGGGGGGGGKNSRGGGAWDDRELIDAFDAAKEEFELHNPGPGSWLDKATAALALGKPLPGAKLSSSNLIRSSWYSSYNPLDDPSNRHVLSAMEQPQSQTQPTASGSGRGKKGNNNNNNNNNRNKGHGGGGAGAGAGNKRKRWDGNGNELGQGQGQGQGDVTMESVYGNANGSGGGGVDNPYSSKRVRMAPPRNGANNNNNSNSNNTYRMQSPTFQPQSPTFQPDSPSNPAETSNRDQNYNEGYVHRADPYASMNGNAVAGPSNTQGQGQARRLPNYASLASPGSSPQDPQQQQQYDPDPYNQLQNQNQNHSQSNFDPTYPSTETGLYPPMGTTGLRAGIRMDREMAMMRACNAQWWAGYWFAMSEVMPPGEGDLSGQ